MPVDVVMPQMGESVAEGTIVRWIKQVGESIDKDEPLFEISTDKVDAEIPAPEAGVLLEIRVAEGETVPVNSVVAVIGQAGDEPAAGGGPAAVETPAGAVFGARAAAPVSDTARSVDDLRRTRSSPVVRRIATEYDVDLREVEGTGASGRVTRKDIEDFVLSGRRATTATTTAAAPAAPAVVSPGENVRIEPMGIMRRKIAEHMVASVRTSPHVYSTYEVDLGRVDELRRARKADYEAAGARLTYTAFIAAATAATLREFPIVNASLDGTNIVYRNDINLGIAVALEQGLIVPVIRAADTRSVMDLCRIIQDLAQRARSKQLRAEEVQGGTFTITNPGVFGAMMGLPIISQPQVAILAVGGVEKRAVVVGDEIVARPTCYVTLGHDHRLIDGADGARFLQALKDRLQGFDESLL